LYIL